MTAIFPSSRPNISVRAIPKIPATLIGVGGIGVSKDRGVWTIQPAWDDLALIAPGILLDPTTKEVWVRDPVTDVYNRMTLGGLGQALFWGTSSTPNLIGAGSRTFATQSGKDWLPGMFVQAFSTGVITNYMIGQVTSYIGTTLVVNVLAVGGSGTPSDWTIVQSTLPGSGPPGAAGSAGGLNYNFAANLSGDPGSGCVAFDSAVIASITTMRISDFDRNGVYVASGIQTWDDSTTSGHRARVRVYSGNSPAKFVNATIIGPSVDNVNYTTFPIGELLGTTMPDVGDCQVEVYRTGDMGIQGPPGVPGGVVTISDTPPLLPVNGQEWFESDTGNTYIWYDDGSSAQWIHTNGATAAASTYTSDGTGAVERTVHAKLSDHVNVLDFGIDMTGVTDSAAKLINALAQAAATTGVLHIPNGIVRLNSTVNIPPGVALIGAGMPAREGPDASYPGLGVRGTWFLFAHSGFGFTLLASTTGLTLEASRTLTGFGTYRPQPAPGAGPYTPAAHEWDIVISSSNEVYLSDLMLLNPTKGIWVSADPAAGRGSGRVDMRRIFAHPFLIGMKIEYVYDVCRFNEIHFWPFWSTNQNVMQYTNANAYAMVFGRADTMQMDHIFTYAYRFGLTIVTSPELVPGTIPGGTIGNAQIGSMTHDAVQTGLSVQADGATFTIGELVIYNGPWGATNVPRAYEILSSGCDIRITDLKAAGSGSMYGVINGASNLLRIGEVMIFLSDVNATGAAQFQCAANNKLYIGGTPNHDAALDKFVSGAGVLDCNVLRSHAPTLSSGAAGPPIGTAFVRYRRFNDMLDMTYSITITNSNGAGGDLRFNSPLVMRAGLSTCAVGNYRNNADGSTGVAYAGPGGPIVVLVKYDGGFPAVTGANPAGNISYLV